MTRQQQRRRRRNRLRRNNDHRVPVSDDNLQQILDDTEHRIRRNDNNSQQTVGASSNNCQATTISPILTHGKPNWRIYYSSFREIKVSIVICSRVGKSSCQKFQPHMKGGWTAVPSAARRGALDLRCASRVCTPGIAAPRAK